MRQAKRMNDLKMHHSAMAPDTIEVVRADSASWKMKVRARSAEAPSSQSSS